MTIFFNVKPVRDFLVSKGCVYTLRKKRFRIGKDIAVHGSYYKWTKIADVWIELVPIGEVINYSQLRSFVKYSGLWDSSVPLPLDNFAYEWYGKARKLNKASLKNPIELYLYKVKVIGKCPKCTQKHGKDLNTRKSNSKSR